MKWIPRSIAVGITATAILSASLSSSPSFRSGRISPAAAAHAAVVAWKGWVTTPADAKTQTHVLGGLVKMSPTAQPATTSLKVETGNDPVDGDWRGVGASLTDTSVELLKANPKALKLLYGDKHSDSAGLNLLRLPLSSTDFSRRSWTWEMPDQSDPPQETTDAVAVIKQIKALQPDLEVVATAWSAPAAMKANDAITGRKSNNGKEATLLHGQEGNYADLLATQARYLLAQGVPLRAMTLGNEPGYAPPDYAGMKMSTDQMIRLAKDLQPRLARLKPPVKLWAWDHNDSPQKDGNRPLTNEEAAVNVDRAIELMHGAPKSFTAAAFHCYGSNLERMADLKETDKILTECTGTEDSLQSTLAWDMSNLIVSGTARGLRGIFFWNLALHKNGPRLGGCRNCRGLLEVNPKVRESGRNTRGPEFYTLAHLAKAVDAGKIKLFKVSMQWGTNVSSVAFLNSNNEIGVVGVNNDDRNQVIEINVPEGGSRRFAVPAHAMFTVRGLPGTAPDPDPVTAKKIFRTPDGARFYRDDSGYLHMIPSEAVYACLGGDANTVDVGLQKLQDMPRGEAAACFTARPGDILRHPDGDSYVYEQGPGGARFRRWIPTVRDYICARAQGGGDGRREVTVARYHLTEMFKGADWPGRSCILRGPGGDAQFVNSEGKREWIPDSPTYDCEVGRNVPVFNVSDGFIHAVGEAGWHYCLNKANLWGKVLRHSDGDASFIQADDTRTWIPDGATFACRQQQGKPVVETRWRQYVEAFKNTGWDYCYDVETLKSTVVKHPDGDSHFVDYQGLRHWIPTTGTYGCFAARGTPVQTVRWREYINRTPEGEWAVCGDTLGRNQKLDRGQSLRSNGGGYHLEMQGDGNLVVYNAGGRAIWATGRFGQFTVLQSDGNLVEYPSSGSAVWGAGTVGTGATKLVMQSDGNLVAYNGARPVWASNTVGR